MITDTSPPRQHAPQVARPLAAEGSYVDWDAILAGGVLALAITFLLISFGAGLGLSLTSPYRGEGVSARWLAIAAGLWFAWVMVTGFGAGGYLAGRMRRRAGDATPDEVTARDGAHGLIVWATGALVSTILAALSAGSLASAGASAVGSTAGTAAEMVEEAIASDYFANVMLRRGDIGGDLAPTGDTYVDPAIQAEIAGIIGRSALEGDMAERDSSYLAQLVAANTDLDQTAARARVDEVTAEIAEARARALAAIERARVAAVIFGFISAATLLIGAIAAFFAAAAGGRHRDEGLGFDIFSVRR